MNDYEIYRLHYGSIFDDEGTARVGDPVLGLDVPDEFRTTFPKLTQLLAQARVTPLRADGADYVTFGWGEDEDTMLVWISPAPTSAVGDEVCPDHQLLLATFGGIIETTDGPPSLLDNMNHALTYKHIAPFFEDMVRSQFEERQEVPPFEFEAYYTLAGEANGDSVICHRRTGQLLKVSHDPDARVPMTALDGWPRNTLFAFDFADTFRAWVEWLAEEWLGI